jgi:hypothetical protein
MVLTIFGLIFGAGLIVSGGVCFSRDVNKYVAVSQIIVGALFVVLAILLLAGVKL